jgi:hypothetical protein
MIVCDAKQLVILHVPRTGITSLYRKLEAIGWNEGTIFADPIEMLHATSGVATAHWPTYQQVIVMRNPWEIFASFYGVCQRWRYIEPPENWIWDRWAKEDMFQLARMPFPDYVRRSVARDRHSVAKLGGFSNLYGGDKAVVLQYGDRVYETIGAMLGCNLSDIPRENSGIYKTSVKWTEESVALVREYCWLDIERFGYEPPR